MKCPADLRYLWSVQKKMAENEKDGGKCTLIPHNKALHRVETSVFSVISAVCIMSYISKTIKIFND